jgi:hypothetical protein
MSSVATAPTTAPSATPATQVEAKTAEDVKKEDARREYFISRQTQEKLLEMRNTSEQINNLRRDMRHVEEKMASNLRFLSLAQTPSSTGGSPTLGHLESNLSQLRYEHRILTQEHDTRAIYLNLNAGLFAGGLILG